MTGSVLCYWFTSKCSHSHSHAINQCTFTFTLNVTPVGQPVCFVRLSCVLGACVPRVPWTVGGGGGCSSLKYTYGAIGVHLAQNFRRALAAGPRSRAPLMCVGSRPEKRDLPKMGCGGMVGGGGAFAHHALGLGFFVRAKG